MQGEQATQHYGSACHMMSLSHPRLSRGVVVTCSDGNRNGSARGNGGPGSSSPPFLLNWIPGPYYSVAFGWPWPEVISSRRLSLM
jgi:hypothetical protein